MKIITVVFHTLILLFSLALGQQAKATESKDAPEGFWTVLEVYPVNHHASCLTWDGEYIYIGTVSSTLGPNLYRFNPVNGLLELHLSGPHNNAYGLTTNGEYFWILDRELPSSTPAYVLQVDLEGNLVTQFDLANYYMAGITWDEGNFWVATTSPSPGLIHQIDGQGEEIFSFVPPQRQTRDLALENGYLWIAEFDGPSIHKVDLQGEWQATYPTINARAVGVVHDGNYLWYLSRETNGNSFLYKVDPHGVGNGWIDAPHQHHMGQITLGDQGLWNMSISNTGEGPLHIESISFEQNSLLFSVDTELPLTIEGNTSMVVPVIFDPDQIGYFETTLVIHSNDLLHPETNVEITAWALESGPFLYTEQELIDFGVIRIHSSNKGYLELTNMGDTRIQFEDIVFSHADFTLDPQVGIPFSLNSTQSTSVPFWFKPSTEGSVSGQMTLYFDNPDQSPYSIEVKGLSEDTEYPLGYALWSHDFKGTGVNNPRAILVGDDVNEDGRRDVFVSTRGEKVYAFAGNSSGDASVLWETFLGTAEYPKTMAMLDDINEDGFNDLVVGTAWADRAITALSARTGEILWRYETNAYGYGGWVYMVDASKDFNGNGYRDVLAATGNDMYGSGPRRIFLFNGKTGEIIWQRFMGAAAFSVLAVEDFTGDGVPDVIAGATTVNQQGRVVAINGATGEIEWQKTTGGTSVWALEQLDDITGNGIKDILAGSYNGIYYLIDVTTGEALFTHNLGGNALILDFWRAGDLNGDGFTDFIPAYTTVNNAVAISGKDGQLIWSTPIADQSWSVAPLNDITGNGINDVAIGTLYSNNRVYFLNGATGEILETIHMRDAVDVITALPDITGDNSMEVVAGVRDNFMIALSGGTAVAPQPYMATFTVTDDQQPANLLENASIVITENGRATTTDANGVGVIDLDDGSWSYTVSKENYYPVEGSFTIAGADVDIDVVLSASDTHLPELTSPRLALLESYPNPFSDHTSIVFTLTQPTEVSVAYYDMDGRRVSIKESEFFPAGKNTLKWEGRNQHGSLLTDGIYFIEVLTGDSAMRTKVMILRN